jgi:hypothetical protein
MAKLRPKNCHYSKRKELPHSPIPFKNTNSYPRNKEALSVKCPAEKTFHKFSRSKKSELKLFSVKF